MTALRCAHCHARFEGRANKLYCSQRCQGRAASKRKRAREGKRKPAAGPRYSYRVRWRRSNYDYVQSRFYERLENAERFVREEKSRRDLMRLIEISIERRRVAPWRVVDQWREW